MFPLPPLAPARRHRWSVQGVLGGSSLEHAHLVDLPFAWGKSSRLQSSQPQHQASKVIPYTNNNSGLYAAPRAAVHHSVGARLMITSEGFSLTSHLEDGWSLVMLIFIHSHIAFVDFDFP